MFKVNNFFDKLLLYFFYLIPLALLTGPFIPDLFVSLSVLILIIITLLKKKFILYFWEKKIIFFYFFCVYLIFSSFLSKNIYLSLESSLFYIRFGLYCIVVKYIFLQNNNLFYYYKYFLSIALLIVVVTGFYEFFNLDVFELNYVKGGQVTGIFGEEKIMGSYLSRISPILFAVLLMQDNFFKKKSNILYFFLCFIILFSLIIFSGERVAFINFLTFSLLIIVFNVANLRKIVFYLLSCLIIILFTTYYTKITDLNFRIIDKTIEFSGIDENKIFFLSDHHRLHLLSAISIFRDNPFIGSGPKLFRELCNEEKHFRDYLDIYPADYLENLSQDQKGYDENARLRSLTGCSTHPHNIYLQILTETGIFGMLFFLCFMIYIIIKVFSLDKIKNYYNFKISLLFLILTNFSPIVSSGSFFNNYFNILLFLPIVIFYALETENK